MTRNEKLAETIRVFRAKKRMSQSDLAKATGLAESTIAFIETCRRTPRPETLVKIADAFEIDSEILLKYLI